MLDDRPAELLALLGVADRVVQRRPGHADALRGDADPPALQRRERDLETLALGADALVVRHLHVVERQRAAIGGLLAQLVLDPGDAEARRVVVDDEAGDALLAGVRVGDCEQDRGLADAGVGDELLASR